jgi:hypothetical protein
VAIPADRNVVQKEMEKKLKYKSLCIEIQQMWNLKCTIIPVITGVTGIVTRSLRKKFGSCTRKTFDRFSTKDGCTWNVTHNTESTAVLKPERCGDHCWFKRITRKNRPVTRDIIIITIIMNLKILITSTAFSPSLVIERL